jgi:hypothetical protein
MLTQSSVPTIAFTDIYTIFTSVGNFKLADL